jgi:hypothetical protein
MPPQQGEAGLDGIGEVGELGAHGGMSVVFWSFGGVGRA